jgi:hypothetical protein
MPTPLTAWTPVAPARCFHSIPSLVLSLCPSGKPEREELLAIARHHLRHRVPPPANHLCLIARAPCSTTSPSSPNKQPCRLTHIGMAQSSVPTRATMAGAAELMLRPLASLLLLSPLEPLSVFASFSWTPCALHLARSWPEMAVGHGQPPCCCDAENIVVVWPFPPLGFLWAR